MLERACPSEYQRPHCAILDGLLHEDANVSTVGGWEAVIIPGVTFYY
jgi:hypothetical protein